MAEQTLCRLLVRNFVYKFYKKNSKTLFFNTSSIKMSVVTSLSTLLSKTSFRKATCSARGILDKDQQHQQCRELSFPEVDLIF